MTGKVRITRTGFTKVFRSPNTMATTRAVVYESTVTPGITYADTNTAIVAIISFNIKFTVIILNSIIDLGKLGKMYFV